jgi:hypothetical protein
VDIQLILLILNSLQHCPFSADHSSLTALNFPGFQIRLGTVAPYQTFSDEVPKQCQENPAVEQEEPHGFLSTACSGEIEGVGPSPYQKDF